MPSRPLLWAACLVFWAAAAPWVGAAAEPSPPQSVLWIGNSFTYYNGGVPKMVQALADARRPPAVAALRVGMLATGGAHLPDHVRRADLPAVLERGWDAVVVQGYSDEPVNPAKAPAFHKALAALAARIKTSGARLLLFVTWAYKDQPAMTEALAAAYADAAQATGADAVPVGLAFAAARAERPDLALYVTTDNKHPSLAGTYLAACTFYAYLSGRSPAEARFYPKGLAEKDAVFLQRIAWETVSALTARAQP